MFAMTAIRGIGRRFSNLICKKADIDLSKVRFDVQLLYRHPFVVPNRY